MSPPPAIPGRTSILYNDDELGITLMDIPTSIAIAQGRPDDILRSQAPLEEPYIIHNEPKGKAKERHTFYSSNPMHAEYKTAIEEALSVIRGHVLGLPWCLTRKVLTQVPRTRKKKDGMEIDDPEKDLSLRLREWSEIKEETLDFETMMAQLCATGDPNATPWLMSYMPAHRHGTPKGTEGTDDLVPPEPWTSSFYNPTDDAMDLTVFENPSFQSQSTGGSKYKFRIPPRSSMFLKDTTHANELGGFRTSFRELTAEYTLPRHFHFVLLDPPWPNKSAKTKGAYDQIGGMPYMMKLLKLMDIDNYIEHNGIVGVWTTNKDSMRNHVVGPGGLFEQWNLGLVEEWIWIKTTVKGEPMFSLDSEWRKPYEVLLLGRAAPDTTTKMKHAPVVRKRVIAAVPDVHSRKPCLKELIEPLMENPKDYSALEIFSRYLVEGWTSWGNEVVKFNSDMYWASGDDPSAAV